MDMKSKNANAFAAWSKRVCSSDLMSKRIYNQVKKFPTRFPLHFSHFLVSVGTKWELIPYVVIFTMVFVSH
ncbi:hypothetical protein [Desulfopila aestuarii]|uniref:Uncharacterized protein n=1 Tax=Desulfopila aestuarii DSM 18488 TaxID=1121416 RepID=A0A1M7YFL0_9BACT|nr:hypothetical protein [Desulfopila aestuarii]SHO51410.1 hypothetical protein SAMN02745220_03992 [Desulfopila aestuarii DSM 18488]